MIALLAVIGIAVAIALTPNKYTIPDVTNMPLEEAIAEIEAAGFAVGKQEELNHEEVEKGHIIETT